MSLFKHHVPPVVEKNNAEAEVIKKSMIKSSKEVQKSVEKLNKRFEANGVTLLIVRSAGGHYGN